MQRMRRRGKETLGAQMLVARTDLLQHLVVFATTLLEGSKFEYKGPRLNGPWNGVGQLLI